MIDDSEVLVFPVNSYSPTVDAFKRNLKAKNYYDTDWVLLRALLVAAFGVDEACVFYHKEPYFDDQILFGKLFYASSDGSKTVEMVREEVKGRKVVDEDQLESMLDSLVKEGYIEPAWYAISF